MKTLLRTTPLYIKLLAQNGISTMRDFSIIFREPTKIEQISSHLISSFSMKKALPQPKEKFWAKKSSAEGEKWSMTSVLKMNSEFKERSLFSILATLRANSRKEADISLWGNQLSNMEKSFFLILISFPARILESCRKITILGGFSQFTRRWMGSNPDDSQRKSENFAVRFQTIFPNTYLRNFWKNFSF